MNTDYHKGTQSYIIVRITDEGHLKPITFRDGTLVVYGSKDEAEYDMEDGDMLASISVEPNA